MRDANVTARPEIELLYGPTLADSELVLALVGRHESQTRSALPLLELGVTRQLDSDREAQVLPIEGLRRVEEGSAEQGNDNLGHVRFLFGGVRGNGRDDMPRSVSATSTDPLLTACCQETDVCVQLQ